MLRQHKYYVYYDGPKVLARMDAREPIVVAEFKTVHEAHDLVQSIVNPEGKPPSAFGHDGYNSQEFQQAISPNCEATVKKAYGEA